MKLSYRNSARWTASASVLALVGLMATQASVVSAASSRGLDWAKGKDLAYETVESYSNGYLVSAQEFTVSDLSGWQQKMDELAGDLMVAPAPIPDVGTWNNCAVVMVAMGDNSNYRSLEVTGVRLHGNRLLVTVALVPSGTGGGVYSPYTIVRVELGKVSMNQKILSLAVDYVCAPCLQGKLGTQVASSSGALSQDLSTGVEKAPAKEAPRSWGAVKGMYR